MATRIIGDKELRRKLNKLKDMRSLVPKLEDAATHVLEAVKVYPPESHRPQPFVSDKQRRYFFWALKQGLIEVPYRRGQSPGTERHKQSWTRKGMKGGLRQVIGSNTSYGPLLQDAQKQTAYHKDTGWKTTEQVKNEEKDWVLRQLHKEVDRLLAS